MRIGLGVVIAVILIFFWYRQDHPEAFNASPAAAPAVAAPSMGGV